MTRQHRLEAAYPALWRAIDGAVRDAVACHPDIVIPDKRRASIVKRVVGQVLALQGAGAGQPAEMADAIVLGRAASGAQVQGAEGAGQVVARPHHAWAWLSTALAAKDRKELRFMMRKVGVKFVAFHRGQAGLIFVEVRRK
jgi:hypothetical protein